MVYRYTALDLAASFRGLHEISGNPAEPLILAMIRECGEMKDATSDEIAWCSAFVNFVAKRFAYLPRTGSLRARSWLRVGIAVDLASAKPGWDVVVFRRGADSPGADVLDAPGHVAFFVSLDQIRNEVVVMGGNQGDSVKESRFPINRVLSVRRLCLEDSND